MQDEKDSKPAMFPIRSGATKTVNPSPRVTNIVNTRITSEKRKKTTEGGGQAQEAAQA